jgi:hypothetical protein
MLRSLPLLLVFASVPAPAVAQSATPAPLAFFSKLVGEWRGDAWIMMGPAGRQVSQLHETIDAVAGGTVFTVKGIGSTRLPDGTTRKTHDAFAVVYLDRDKVTPLMRAHVAEGGNWVEPELTLTENSYRWQMQDPRAGLVRYELQIDASGRWVEKGYRSGDAGVTWMQFFEATLERVR